MGDSELQVVAERARTAARALALATRAAKDAALHAMADDLERASSTVLAANLQDLELSWIGIS